MKKKHIRFVYMILVGAIVSFVLHFIAPPKVEQIIHNEWNDLILSILITILIWEGSLRLDHWLNKRLPWVERAGIRVLVQLILNSAYSILVIYSAMWTYNHYVCPIPSDQQAQFFVISIVFGTLISVILLAVEIGNQFFKHWKNTLVEVEKHKAASTHAQLENLKNQINPHFLFNNMSVLSSLVYKDQDKAVDFIHQLSKVYRYLLDSHNSELVTLEEEMRFLDSYTYLLNIRYSPNLKFDIHISEDCLQCSIPPMSVQLLIENAIKHNEISSAFPLTISIRSAEETLIVENTLKLRASAEESSGTGLKNIQSRYQFFTDAKILVNETTTHFIVQIPLLKTP